MLHVLLKKLELDHQSIDFPPGSSSKPISKWVAIRQKLEDPVVKDFLAILIENDFECAPMLMNILQLCSERGEINEERLERVWVAAVAAARYRSAKRLQHRGNAEASKSS